MPSETEPHAPIVVTFTPTRGEFVRFNMRFSLNRMVLLICGSWLAVILYAVYCSSQFTRDAGANHYAFVFSAASTVAVILVIIPLGAYRAAVRRWNTASELREQRRYTFTDGGIQVTGETYAAFSAWSHIVRVGRLAGQVYLGTNQNQFHLIPVTAFGDQWEEFRTLVAEKVETCRL
ncbi:YcxB family protein [Gemmata sp. JC673]|uniref:YcxB family protein n=1 Tax=Gemmata algarum TaxID=2975278 RepID=A0ABU5F5V2_9BACT|nr:YcxB family protein [Gemmata algarum]MDY3562956.1 YcxB family protein [Gemmata algarum]